MLFLILDNPLRTRELSLCSGLLLLVKLSLVSSAITVLLRLLVEVIIGTLAVVSAVVTTLTAFASAIRLIDVIVFFIIIVMTEGEDVFENAVLNGHLAKVTLFLILIALVLRLLFLDCIEGRGFR